MGDISTMDECTSSRPRLGELFYQCNLGLKRVCWDPKAKLLGDRFLEQITTTTVQSSFNAQRSSQPIDFFNLIV